MERYYHLLTLRGGMAGACFITALAYGLYSTANTVWMFDLAATISGFGYGFGSIMAVGVLIRNWFTKRRGTALGISAVGSGISMLLFPPLVTRIIERWGTVASFRVQALMALLAGFLLWVIVWDTPAQLGLEPYGGPAEPDAYPKTATKMTNPRCGTVPGVTVMLVVCVLIGALAVAAPGHFSTYFTGRGYPMEQVSLGISAFGMALVLGKISCGVQFDRLDGQIAALVFFAVGLTGCVLCCLSSGGNVLPMLGGLTLMGIGLAPATVGLPI